MPYTPPVMSYLDPELIVSRLRKACRKRGRQTDLIKFMKANGKPDFNKCSASRWATGFHKPSLKYIGLIQRWLDKKRKVKRVNKQGAPR